MKVKIESAALREGKPHSHLRCPLALTLRVQTGHRVRVYRNVIVVHAECHDLHYRITPSAKAFIRAFDSGQRCYPTTVDLGEPKLEKREGAAA